MACRSESRAKDEMDKIKKIVKNAKLTFIKLDLSDLQSVKEFVVEFEKMKLPIHMLINNAGIGFIPPGKTKQGFELIFGTNHLGNFLLTNLLLDNIKSNNGRIINVSSKAHIRKFCEIFVDHSGVDKIYYDDLRTDLSGVSMRTRYAHSKLANVLFTYELARKLEKDSTTKAQVVAVHPGWVYSGFDRHINFFLRVLCAPIFFMFAKTNWQGAQTTLHCALSPEIQNGRYYAECKPEKTSEYTYDKEVAEKLWKLSEEFVSEFTK